MPENQDPPFSKNFEERKDATPSSFVEETSESEPLEGAKTPFSEAPPRSLFLKRWLPRAKILRDFTKNNKRVVLGQFSAFFFKKGRESAEFLKKYNRGISLFLKIGVCIMCAHFLSEMNAVFLEKWIPDPAMSFSLRNNKLEKNAYQEKMDFEGIVRRNLFNSKGLLPGADIVEQGASNNPDSPAVKTSLSIKVIGVMILQQEDLSIASLEDGASHQTYPVRKDDEIPNRLRVLSVEEGRVVFVNLQNNRKEYIEFSFQKDITNTKTGIVVSSANSGSSENRTIARKEVDTALSDLNNVLTQAKAVPNFENGKALGYKLFQIMPGSIFDRLGLKNGDVIIGLNGQAVSDPAKALELLTDLKTSNHIEVQLKKENGSVNYVYDIQDGT